MESNDELIDVNDLFFSKAILVSLSYFYCLVPKGLREPSDSPALFKQIAAKLYLMRCYEAREAPRFRLFTG